MDERVAKLKSPKEARTFAKNARERGFSELESQAVDRARELQAIGEGYTSPAEQAIAMSLYAHEDRLRELHGRRQAAGNTRKQFAIHGVLGTAERIVLTRAPSSAYKTFEAAGQLDQTYEAIIDRFPHEFSEDAVLAARARLAGVPLPRRRLTPSVVDEERPVISTPIKLDPEALLYLDGFRAPTGEYLGDWLPRYRRTITEIADALAVGNLDVPFHLLWRVADNSISRAGQGVLAFDKADALRDELIQVIRDIREDGSPANFVRIAERFEGWKAEGRTNKVPRLMIARAFAGIHPSRYHTTVDDGSQGEILEWFIAHTGFVLPRATDWASRAQALARHLDRTEVFDGDFHVRNLFPWAVRTQLRARLGAKEIKPGFRPRPSSAIANLPAAQRFIELRHNGVQRLLYAQLVAEHGESWVFTEHQTGTGGLADAVVKYADRACTLYEIKIADCAALAVREAMGQLLEYGFRAKGLEPGNLVVVGEHQLDDTTFQFLARLRSDFSLPIDYLQVALPVDFADWTEERQRSFVMAQSA